MGPLPNGCQLSVDRVPGSSQPSAVCSLQATHAPLMAGNVTFGPDDDQAFLARVAENALSSSNTLKSTLPSSLDFQRHCWATVDLLTWQPDDTVAFAEAATNDLRQALPINASGMGFLPLLDYYNIVANLSTWRSTLKAAITANVCNLTEILMTPGIGFDFARNCTVTGRIWSRHLYIVPRRIKDSDAQSLVFDDIKDLARSSLPESYSSMGDRTISAIGDAVSTNRPASAEYVSQRILNPIIERMVSEAAKKCASITCPTLMGSDSTEVGIDGVGNRV